MKKASGPLPFWKRRRKRPVKTTQRNINAEREALEGPLVRRPQEGTGKAQAGKLGSEDSGRGLTVGGGPGWASHSR